MKKYKLLIFDVDGTLINPSEGVSHAVQYVIDKYDLPALSSEELDSFNGPPINRSFSKYYNVSNSQINEMVESFRLQYKNNDLLKANVYPGIYTLLSDLVHMGYFIGIATYKREDYAKKLLEYLEFNKYTNAIFGSDFHNKFSKKDIIINCINHFNITDYSKVLMIGDSDNDAVAAQNIGVDFLGVTYGFGFKDKQDMNVYNPVYSANTVYEIGSYLKGLNV